jgi:hypothetical protein
MSLIISAYYICGYQYGSVASISAAFGNDIIYGEIKEGIIGLKYAAIGISHRELWLSKNNRYRLF